MILNSIIDIIWITLTLIVGGEPAIIFLSFAAAMSKISLVVVAMAGYLTAVIGMPLWFIIIRKLSPGKVRKWKFIKKTYDAYCRTISKVERKKPLRLLFLSRSLYGGGFAAIIYLAGTSLSVKKMILYSALVNAFWVALAIFAGWEAGKGFTYALYLFEDIRTAMTIIVVAAAVIYLAFYIIRKNIKK